MNKDDPKINQQCRDCEKWIEADLFYAIGVIPKDNKETFSIFFLQGECMNAPTQFYEKILQKLQTDIAKLSYNFQLETKELGRLNRIDPLKYFPELEVCLVCQIPLDILIFIKLIKPKIERILFNDKGEI